MAVVTLHRPHADEQQAGDVLDRIALGIVAQDHALRTGQPLCPVDQLGHKAFHLPGQGGLGLAFPQAAVEVGRQLVDLPDPRGLPVLRLASGRRKALGNGRGKAAGKGGGQHQHPRKEAQGAKDPADAGGLGTVAVAALRYQRHRRQRIAIRQPSGDDLVLSEIGRIVPDKGVVVPAASDPHLAGGRQVRPLRAAQHGLIQKESIPVHGGQQHQKAAVGAGDRAVGQAEVELAELHAADAPHRSVPIPHGNAQQRHTLPGIQQRHPPRPEAAAGEPLTLPRHDLPVAGDQGRVQLQIPAVMKLQAVFPGGIHRSPEIGCGAAGMGGAQTGIAEIHPHAGGFGFRQRCIGCGIQTEIYAAAGAARHGGFQSGDHQGFQLCDKRRIVIQRVKGETAVGKKALQFSADRFGKLNALRGEGIHLGSKKCGGVALLQSRRFSELACCAGEDTRHAQQ